MTKSFSRREFIGIGSAGLALLGTSGLGLTSTGCATGRLVRKSKAIATALSQKSIVFDAVRQVRLDGLTVQLGRPRVIVRRGGHRTPY